MAHSFKVGGRYRNRDGKYEVMEIDGPRGHVRYTDDPSMVATVETRARICANMSAESPARATQSCVVQEDSRYRNTPKGVCFDGLVDSDFQNGVAGTTWRSRERLGGLLYLGLSAEARQAFRSRPIYRRPEVHIVRPEHYCRRGNTGHRDAKFVFDLNEDRARFGFYIEKNSGPMDETWHWPNLLAALKANEALRVKTQEAMHRLRLEWELNVWSKPPLLVRVAASADGLAWPEVLGRLSQLDESLWCDLYLCARLGKTEAIAAGAGIADMAVAVYRELLPLYDATVG